MPQDPRARQYQAMRHRLLYAGLFLDGLVLAVLLWGGLSVRLGAWARTISPTVWMHNGLYLISLLVVFYVVQLPLRWGAGFYGEHRYGLSLQSLGRWWREDLKQGLFRLALFLFLGESLYFFLGRWPRGWWLAAGFFWLTVTLFLTRVMPRFIIPLFYKYVPVGDPAVLAAVRGVLDRCRVPIREVYAIDLSRQTKKANAFVCGWGRSRRVVLSDTLLAGFAPAEIAAVVAHEIGHDRHRDVLKLIAVNSAVMLAGFWILSLVLPAALQTMGISRVDDIAGLPMMILFLTGLGLLLTPLGNAYSRHLERQADLFSLRTIDRVEDFISMMEKLGGLNLAEFAPGRLRRWLFYDHPPLAERLAMARDFTGESGDPRARHCERADGVLG